MKTEICHKLIQGGGQVPVTESGRTWQFLSCDSKFRGRKNARKGLWNLPLRWRITTEARYLCPQSLTWSCEGEVWILLVTQDVGDDRALCCIPRRAANRVWKWFKAEVCYSQQCRKELEIWRTPWQHTWRCRIWIVSWWVWYYFDPVFSLYDPHFLLLDMYRAFVCLKYVLCIFDFVWVAVKRLPESQKRLWTFTVLRLLNAMGTLSV